MEAASCSLLMVNLQMLADESCESFPLTLSTQSDSAVSQTSKCKDNFTLACGGFWLFRNSIKRLKGRWKHIFWIRLAKLIAVALELHFSVYVCQIVTSVILVDIIENLSFFEHTVSTCLLHHLTKLSFAEPGCFTPNQV